MENTNKCQFLITKQEKGETLTELDELLSAETFSDEQAEQVDVIMKQLGDLTYDTASAIGDLLMAVTNQPEIAKYADGGYWNSLTGTELIEVPCLVKKNKLNRVDEFVQKFITKAEMEADEIEIINKALETISDLDDASLNAVHNLLKVEFSEATVTRVWPSMFKHTEVQKSEQAAQQVAEQESVKKTGLKWPSLQSHL